MTADLIAILMFRGVYTVGCIASGIFIANKFGVLVEDK